MGTDRRNRNTRAVTLNVGYAQALRRALQLTATDTVPTAGHPARQWAESGLMSLTGYPECDPQLAPVPLPDCADHCLALFREICGSDVLPGCHGGRLLTERAAVTGLSRRGAISPGGSCYLLMARDGAIALNMSRDSDWELLEPWLQHPCEPNWQAVSDAVAVRTRSELIAQGELLGLAIADGHGEPALSPWLRRTRHAVPVQTKRDRPPKVLDLSSLWAGPLCTHLWQLAGAEVVKVESTQRPDAARSGSADFFARLNNGKQLCSLPLHTDAGRAALRQYIAESDIVLEASRPRALQQMGLHAETLLAEQPGLTWVSITGYGRDIDHQHRIAFGDDAAVSAGLSRILHSCTNHWLFCGDAIADPLTGLHAALAGWASWQRGGGELVDVSLAGTVAHCTGSTAPQDGDYPRRHRDWLAWLDANPVDINAPVDRCLPLC